MKYLLDTHAFIWLGSKSSKLSKTVLALCDDPENELIVSAASIWEMQIKVQLGKLDLDIPLDQVIAEQKEANQIQLLAVNVAHVLALGSLPMYHKDPFDRILVAQTLVEDAVFISNDPLVAKYPVSIIW
jgi:PIN domain nuclease of toxin-antitoxin system